MDGFPSAYAITERKKHELDDLIENLKNLIKTLIMIRYLKMSGKLVKTKTHKKILS